MNIALLVWYSIQYVNVVIFYDYAKAEINYLNVLNVMYVKKID